MAAWRAIGDDPAKFDVLVEGVPGYLNKPMYEWFRQATNYSLGGLVEEYDSLTRRDPPLVESSDRGVHETYRVLLQNDEFFRFLDFLAYAGGEPSDDRIDLEDILSLERILERGGSAWKVGIRAGNVGLERRVPEGVAEAADAAMNTPGNAGQLLSEAWHAAFGREPDPEKAYSKAIKAVEAAAIPIVSPNNTTATLNTIAGQMKADGDWGLDVTRQHQNNTTAKVIVDMMYVLITGQNDRHAGDPGYTTSTQAEAEAALFISVPLVQWFSSGAVQRR